jgi:hypothetical protein
MRSALRATFTVTAVSTADDLGPERFAFLLLLLAAAHEPSLGDFCHSPSARAARLRR